MFANGEIRAISVHGRTTEQNKGLTIYSPEKGNRAIITAININNNTAYTISLFRYSESSSQKKIPIYTLSLNAGDIIDDSTGYVLNEGDCLHIHPVNCQVNYSIEGFEYQKNCINPPTSGRGSLRVIDSNGNYKGIGATGPQGPQGPAGADGATASVTSADLVSVEAALRSADAALSMRIDGLSVGGASVTSAEFLSLENRVSGNSTQMTSADNALSNAISILSSIVSGVVSNAAALSLAVSVLSTSLSAETVNRISADNALSNAVSVVSAQVVANSAQMTSADNAINNAVSIVSVAQAATSAAVVANSAQMTSADNAISAAQAATSAAVTSVNQAVSVISAAVVSVNQQVSVLSARVAGNSAQMTSADNAISNAVSVVSVAQAATSAAVTSVNQIVSAISANVAGLSLNISAISTRLSALSTAVATNSAQMTSADNAISNAVSIVSVAQAATSADLASVKNIVSVLSARVDSNSADFTSFKASLNNIGDVSISSPVSTQFLGYDSATGQWVNKSVPSGGGGSVTSVEYTSLVNRVSGNSTQMVSADNAISAAVAALSAQHTSLAASVAGALSAIAANSAQMTSADSAISNAVSIVSVAQAATSAAVTSVNNRVSAISADFTSFKASLNNFGDVSLSAPTDGQVLMYNASAGQWFNSAVAAGTGSVTSAELSAVSAAAAAATASVMSAVSAMQYPAIESVASAVYSVVEADRGKIKYFTNATSIEVVLPNGLTSGFQAVLWRASAAGLLKISAATTLESQGTELSTINTGATIIHKGSNVWMAAGAFGSGGGGGGSVTSAELSAVSAAAASANAILSARIGGILNTQIRILSSNQSGNGSALVAVSGMLLTVAANETWKIEGYLLMSTSAATAGLRMGFSVPPLSLPRYAKFIAGSASQSATIAGGGGQMQVSGQSIMLSITGIGPAGAAVPVKFDAFFNVASAGIVNLMACGIASTAQSPLTIMAGTYMICYRLK